MTANHDSAPIQLTLADTHQLSYLANGLRWGQESASDGPQTIEIRDPAFVAYINRVIEAFEQRGISLRGLLPPEIYSFSTMVAGVGRGGSVNYTSPTRQTHLEINGPNAEMVGIRATDRQDCGVEHVGQISSGNLIERAVRAVLGVGPDTDVVSSPVEPNPPPKNFRVSDERRGVGGRGVVGRTIHFEPPPAISYGSRDNHPTPSSSPPQQLPLGARVTGIETSADGYSQTTYYQLGPFNKGSVTTPLDLL